MKFELITLLCWFRFVSLQQTGPPQCVIVQKRVSISSPDIPSFLENNSKQECQIHGYTDKEMMRCGAPNVYIKPECVCSFHNVNEAKFHKYSFCPQGEEADDITQLRCPDCKKYSLNNNGPCINGGNLTCNGNELTHEVSCKCPINYQGRFCEEKVEKVTRICDRIIPTSTSQNLNSCTLTKKDCVTYSRNKLYMYKCYETSTFKDKQDLPFCIDTEGIAEYPATSTDISYPMVPEVVKMGQTEFNSMSGAAMYTYTAVLILMTMNFQLWDPFW